MHKTPERDEKSQKSPTPKGVVYDLSAARYSARLTDQRRDAAELLRDYLVVNRAGKVYLTPTNYSLIKAQIGLARHAVDIAAQDLKTLNEVDVRRAGNVYVVEFTGKLPFQMGWRDGGAT